MTRPHRLLPATLIAALVGASAAPPDVPPPATYRSVGPDGKVTFSDRQPTDPRLHTSQLGKTVYAPLLAPSREPFDLRPATTPPPPRPAPEYGVTPAVGAAGRPFPPGLPEAVLGVLVHQFFVQSLVDTCGRLRPDRADRYQLGVRNWRDRNARILATSNRLNFERFTGEQRDILRATARQRLDPLLPPPGADDAATGAWCDRMSDDLVRRQFELVGDQRLAPILREQGP